MILKSPKAPQMSSCNQNRETFYEAAFFCRFGWTPSIKFILYPICSQVVFNRYYHSYFQLFQQVIEVIWRCDCRPVIFLKSNCFTAGFHRFSHSSNYGFVNCFLKIAAPKFTNNIMWETMTILATTKLVKVILFQKD